MVAPFLLLMLMRLICEVALSVFISILPSGTGPAQ